MIAWTYCEHIINESFASVTSMCTVGRKIGNRPLRDKEDRYSHLLKVQA